MSNDCVLVGQKATSVMCSLMISKHACDNLNAFVIEFKIFNLYFDTVCPQISKRVVFSKDSLVIQKYTNPAS